MRFERSLRILQRFDWGVLLSVFALFSFGLAAITSVELSRGTGEFSFLQKQFIAFGIGATVAIICATLHVSFFRAYARLAYVSGVLLLIGVLFFGRELNGATGWFVFGNFAFQPVEYAKVVVILELARYFAQDARRSFGWRELFSSFLRVAIPASLLFLQPDMGGAAILFATWASIVLFAGIRVRHVAVLAAFGGVSAIIGWFLLFANYQRERILTFLQPLSDPQGTGYNVLQAQIAIGAGGWGGRGLGAGSQSQLRFLPESQTDFIFAVIAEELGFIGVSLVVLAYTILLWRTFSIASRSVDHFSTYLAVGIFSLFLVEAIVHMGANLALLPATGIALPFVSYGGSSLIFSIILIGILQSAAVHLPTAGSGEQSTARI
ncbi:rod shape-determining protein RodA [Patescibacteria group bacterium]|nr:rod shape-determining protein RodA [Patescibacteria group bacterium]